MWQKKIWPKSLFALLPIFLINWGFTAHKDLHAVAITGLPEEIWPFFKSHEASLIEYSVLADKRKHTDSTESFRHYLDLDSPIDSSNERGVLPQAISKRYNLLSYLFYTFDSDSADVQAIIKVAADLGHYIGDAHVPLHTTENYDGQLSGQTGIHSLWETHVYELTREDRIPLKIAASYVSDIDEFAQSIITESHSLVDIVLEKEVAVRRKKGAPPKWGYRTRGRTLDLIPTPGFCREYSEALDGMVQSRFYDSANAIASVWYSAWVDAGSPQLESSHTFNDESRNVFRDFQSKLQELWWGVKKRRLQKPATPQP